MFPFDGQQARWCGWLYVAKKLYRVKDAGKKKPAEERALWVSRVAYQIALPEPSFRLFFQAVSTSLATESGIGT